jgi:predicted MFS family arabinose efflux permease
MASDIAGPDLQATSQGIYTGVYNGFAGIVSSIGGSLILKYLGYKYTFMFSACLTSAALLLVFLLPIVMKKKPGQ